LQHQDGPPTGRHLHPVTGEEAPFDPDYDRPTDTRRPPQDVDAERALLGALLLAPDLAEQLEHEIGPDDFWRPAHGDLWAAIHDLRRTDGVPPDAVTLQAHLNRTGQLKQLGGAPYLHSLIEACLHPHPTYALKYAAAIRDAARLREVDALATRLREIANRGQVDDVQPLLEEAVDRLDEAVVRFGPTTLGPAATGLKDLAWILTGQPPAAPEPVWCRRTDGTALFYAGLVNGVFGDPESGKTWLAQIAIVEALNAGQAAAMIDVDHNGPDHTAARLMLLGARMEHLADPDRFRYYEPEDGEQLRAAVDDVVERRPAVMVLDSLGEVFPMLGVKTNEGDEITAALRLVCTRPAAAGTCVIHIDHLPKGADARATGFAIGSIAKKRSIRGAYLRVEARTQPAPGAVGRMSLLIEKDTNGTLRKTSGSSFAGTFTLDSSEDGTLWHIGKEQTPKNDDGSSRPTGVMEMCSRYIELNDQCSFRELAAGLRLKAKVKDQTIRQALSILAAEGFVAVIPGGPRNSKLHHSTAIYREADDAHQ
jgi:hypothetical protein